jgi:hypothetical protein
MLHLFPLNLVNILLILISSMATITFFGFLAVTEEKRVKRLIKESPVPPPPPEFMNHECPDCGRPLTFVAQYNRWYCYNCTKYP